MCRHRIGTIAHQIISSVSRLHCTLDEVNHNPSHSFLAAAELAHRHDRLVDGLFKRLKRLGEAANAVMHID